MPSSKSMFWPELHMLLPEARLSAAVEEMLHKPLRLSYAREYNSDGAMAHQFWWCILAVAVAPVSW